LSELQNSVENPRPRATALTWVLLGCLAFFVRYYFYGYIVYRSDQLVHVSLLRVLQDPSLFPRDVFLHEFTVGNMRYFYLQLLQTAGGIFGLPLGLFALFALFYALTLWAWFGISKKVFDSYWPGFFFGLIIACHETADVSANGIVETQILPRMVATAALWWSLYFVYLRRAWLGAVLAGLVLAAAIYIHPLVPVQFWPFLALWLLWTKRREAILPVAIMSVVFLGLGIPSFLKTGDVVESYATKADPDAWLLWVYVRAPHHLDINTWGHKLVELAVLTLVGFLLWLRLRKTDRRGWEFGWLFAVFAAFTVLAAAVVKVLPTEHILMAQPFRLVVALRATIYFLLAHHVFELIKRQTFWSSVRGGALVVCGLERGVFFCVLIAEMIILAVEAWARRRQFDATAQSRVYNLSAVVILGALVIAGTIDSDDRKVALMPLAAAAIGWWAVPRPPVREWFARWGLPLAAAAGAILVASTWVLPCEKWFGEPGSSLQRRLARFCFEHAVRPYPIAGIEKVGAWAKENTARDALFLIPPGKQRAGFHPWAERSTVFTIKFFPYVRAGVIEWKKRYLEIRGLGGPDADPARVEEALHDSGAEGTEDDYTDLSVEQIQALVREYGVDYVVTAHEPPYQSPELVQVLEARDSHTRDEEVLRVYRVASPRE